MTTLTQGIQPGEYLLSEASGMRSRDKVTVTVAGAVALPSGTVLGKITATGKFVKYDEAGTDDGRRVAAAVLWNELEGVNGDYQCAVHIRDCEVIGNRLNGGSNVDANGKADLLAVGIIVR
jgi:hypothetical protein